MNKIELTAVARLAVKLANVDENLDPHEVEVLSRGFARFGIGAKDAQQIVIAAASCTDEDAELIVANLSDADKIFVSAWLLSIIAADGAISKNEVTYYEHLVSSCGLINASASEKCTNVPCYRVVCGSGDYDFKTEEEAKDAIRMLSRNDTRFMDRFKIERHDASPEHKFWTLEALRNKIIKDDEEWASQSYFIADDVDAWCKNMLKNRSNLL